MSCRTFPHPLILSLLCAAAWAQAQNTCFTDHRGVTLCSTPDTVINGNTNGSGDAVYRDERGRRLEFHTDYRGSATVRTAGGQDLHWSQPALGGLKYPGSAASLRPPPPVIPGAATPAAFTASPLLTGLPQ